MNFSSKEEYNAFIQNLKIEKEIEKHVDLVKKNEHYRGLCPFHNDSKGNFYVNTTQQYFKCFFCGFSGKIIKFVQAYLNFDFKTSVKYLILENEIFYDKYNYLGKGSVYVLKLVDDKYYIGYTENYCNRMNSHFSGQGAEWTKENHPIEIQKVYRNVNPLFENDLTIMLMKRYGYSRVRGGEYPFREIEHIELKDEIKNRTREGIYILLLQENRYFIGYGLNIDIEIKKHFNGFGCEWTKLFRPIKVIQRIRTRNIEETKKITLEYIKKYGWDNVRGYRWDKIGSKQPEL